MKYRGALCACLIALGAQVLIGQSGVIPYPLAARTDDPSRNNGIYFWDDAVFPGPYRKEADGSFRLVDEVIVDGTVIFSPVTTVSAVAALDVDAYERATAVASVPKGAAPRLPAQSWTALQDLIPGGVVRAARSEDRKKPKVKGKNLLLVLSTNSARSFQAVADMQRRVGVWARGQKDPAIQQAAEAFSQIPFQKAFATALATQLRGAFATVTFAEDLSGFRDGRRFDYALVLDFHFEHQIDPFLATIGKLPRTGRAGTYDIAGPIFGDISWVLLDRARDVVTAGFEAREQVLAINAASVADLFVSLKERMDTNFLTPAKPTADGLYLLGRQLRQDWGWARPTSPRALAQVKAGSVR